MHKFQLTKKTAFFPVLLIISACVNIIRIETGLSPVCAFQSSINQSSIELVNEKSQNYFPIVIKSNIVAKPEGKNLPTSSNFRAIFSSIQQNYNASIIQCFNLIKRPVFSSQYIVSFIHKKSISHKTAFEDPFLNA
jgi:hypothetical protein